MQTIRHAPNCTHSCDRQDGAHDTACTHSCDGESAEVPGLRERVETLTREWVRLGWLDSAEADTPTNHLLRDLMSALAQPTDERDRDPALEAFLTSGGQRTTLNAVERAIAAQPMSAEAERPIHPKPPGPPGPIEHTHPDGTTCWWVRTGGVDHFRAVDGRGNDSGPCPGDDPQALPEGDPDAGLRPGSES